MALHYFVAQMILHAIYPLAGSLSCRFKGRTMKRVLCVLFLIVGGWSRAQTNEMLSWEQCLQITEAKSPELAKARSAVRELEFSAVSASAGFYPHVSAKANYGVSGAESGDTWKTANDRTSAGIDLSQDLFSGFKDVAKRARALAQLKVGQEQYRQTQADVEQRLRLAYVEVIYAQELIELTRKIEERRANNVRLIQLRFDGGRENAGSLARSQAQLAQAKFEARQAERSLVYALRNLGAAMGLGEPKAGVVGDLQAEAPDALENLSSLMQQTPDYLIAETQVAAAREGLRVTRSERFPSLRFSAGLGIATSDGWSERWNGGWDVGLNASVPLFTGGRLRADIAAGSEKVVQSEMELENRANTLLASLQEQWNNYVDAVENESVQKELLEAEQLRAEISTSKYKQGLLSYEDWDQIENNLIQQGKTHLQRRRTAEVEKARWKGSLGWSEWNQPVKGE